LCRGSLLSPPDGIWIDHTTTHSVRLEHTTVDLDAYLTRIGFGGFPKPDLTTLRSLQRCHLEHIAFENFDVQFGRRVTLDLEDAYAKLVTGGRGGWCYEMNGLFLWALESIGFRAMPMTGAMMRAQRGPSAIGSHLVLSVEFDQPYLVDVGLADGPTEPIPLKEDYYEHQLGTLRLERLSDGWWRVHKEAPFFSLSFDFQYQRTDWRMLTEMCHWQQTSPDSRFVQNAICVKHLSGSVIALLGRALKTVDHGEVRTQLVNSAAEYVCTLQEKFGLKLPQAVDLWPKIASRHKALFGS
jgi:N-hydroxyarylamine O-acetyltransferase